MTYKLLLLTVPVMLVAVIIMFFEQLRIASERAEPPVCPDEPMMGIEECRALCAPNPVSELGGYPVTAGGTCRCAVPQ